MRQAIFALLFILIFTGCEGRKISDSETRGIDSSKKNIQVVADNLEYLADYSCPQIEDALSANARILKSQIATIDQVLPPTKLTKEQTGTATVDPLLLKTDPNAAADESIAKDDKQREEIKTSQSVWSKIVNWTGWASVGGVGMAIVVAAQRLLAPQLSAWLSDPLIRLTPIIGRFMKQAEDGQDTISKYKGLVGDSMVGRAALVELQKRLPTDLQSQIAEKIKELTGDENITIDALFRHVANARSTDRGAGAETSDLISVVRDEMKTIDGKVV